MPLKSPFRYPGGKAKLANQIVCEVKNMVGFDSVFSTPNIKTFVDVFTGGGSVTIAVANEYKKMDLAINDLDDWIYSFWASLIDPLEHQRLLYYIEKYKDPTVGDFHFLRKSSERGGLKSGYKGFIGLFFNRTTFSGIFNSGPIGGQDQSGKYKINCRYNVNKIKELISGLYSDFSQRDIKVSKVDFREVIERYYDDDDVLLYLDPPYMKQGYQLYNKFMEDNDYKDMANLLKNCKCKWIISHDDYKPFVDLFSGWSHIKSIRNVAYTINSIEGKRKTELLITKNKI